MRRRNIPMNHCSLDESNMQSAVIPIIGGACIQVANLPRSVLTEVSSLANANAALFAAMYENHTDPVMELATSAPMQSFKPITCSAARSLHPRREKLRH